MVELNVLGTPDSGAALRLLEQIAVARRQPFYAVFGVAEYESQIAGSFGAWIGTQYPVATSEAGGVAWAKFGELVSRGDPYGICTTPVATYKRSLGWKGAIRVGNKIVAVSKLAEEFDLVMAAVGMYAFMGNKIELHHVGRRMNSKKEMRAEAKRLAVHHDSYQLDRPAEDHERIYIPVLHPLGSNGLYYQEVQFDPSAPWDGVEHLDFVVDDPRDFLEFVAAAFGRQPELWDGVGENDPEGCFYTLDADGNALGVMARPRFWDVENDW